MEAEEEYMKEQGDELAGRVKGYPRGGGEGNRGLILQGWTYRELPADLGRIRW